ncbi:MAG: uracil-DNA glycosylase family protein [Candidatus Synoicihabitans palmerolidicus]|nr:uracil-DNA glycosylase family protein [Candidatus Synoicihabitans palmerolidicus]
MDDIDWSREVKSAEESDTEVGGLRSSGGEVEARTPLERHLGQVRACERCEAMHRPAVVSRPVTSGILLVGQAPGDKEPVLGRPFAWTAGKTLLKWFEGALGWTEEDVRNRVYFAAVCRCFPGKRPKGGDRVPSPTEIETCSHWLRREFDLLRPRLVLPVGKLAIQQFFPPGPLVERIGGVTRLRVFGHETDFIPLPHPSGASTWHRMEPGQTLLAQALRCVAEHGAIQDVAGGGE